MRGGNSFQVQAGYACFLQLCDSGAGVKDLAYHQVQVGFVAEAHDFFGLHFRQVAKQFGGGAGSFEGVRANDLA
jgi:hypothetical protein